MTEASSNMNPYTRETLLKELGSLLIRQQQIIEQLTQAQEGDESPEIQPGDWAICRNRDSGHRGFCRVDEIKGEKASITISPSMTAVVDLATLSRIIPRVGDSVYTEHGVEQGVVNKILQGDVIQVETDKVTIAASRSQFIPRGASVPGP